MLLALFFTGCARFHYQPLPPEATLHRARTADGWELTLVRYLPTAPVRGLPVLLCHGIIANERNMDLDAEHSLARWLAARGREVWNLALRDRGDAKGRPLARGRAGYDFDTLWRQDLSAAIRHVSAVSGHPEIDFIGHSMGGMLAYAYLAEHGAGLNAVSALSAGVRPDWSGRYLGAVASLVPYVLQAPVALPIGFASQLGVAFPLEGEGLPLEQLIYNPRNTSPRTIKRLMAFGAGSLPAGLARQLATMVTTGRFGSADGRLDYRQDMGRIRVPVQVVAGKIDRVALTPSVKEAYRALGGPKEWVLLAEENGVEADYGHLDVLLGERASTEVWPRVLAFLDQHRPSAAPAPE